MDLSVVEKTFRPNYVVFQYRKGMKYVGISPMAYYSLIANLDVLNLNIIC
jgi:hypothetical protein